MENQIPAILFDLDGTLINTTPDIALAVNAVRTIYDLQRLTDEFVGSAVGNGATELLKCCFPEELHGDLSTIRQLFIQEYSKHLCHLSHPFQGVEEALVRLKQRAPLGIVTNKPHHLTLQLLDALQWTHHFQIVVGGDLLSERKPSPAPLLHAVKQLGSRPSNTVFIGDTEVDAKAAQAANIAFIAVPYGRVASAVEAGYFGSLARVASISTI